MWVTLYSDASFKDKKSGWAVWIRSEQGRIIKHDSCPPDVIDSLSAECYAAYKGISIILSEWATFNLEGIQLNSDCLTVIDCLRYKSEINVKHFIANKYITAARQLIYDHGLKIRVKHVKAHTGGQDSRSYLNRQVDRFAGKKTK